MVAIKLLTTISLFAVSSLAWVWPLPAKMDVGNTIIRVDKFNLGFSIKASVGSDILERAVERYKKLIFIEGTRSQGYIPNLDRSQHCGEWNRYQTQS
ncbi:hypothetical protein K7432_016128 [Basidiobolus ranarum]|uniref:Uncharacterized protein n=1 Tax=Basidiobolus ranarum TaxID=34480 RepID=A0ABR2VM23_9FUNG